MICPECGSENINELEDGRYKCLDCGHRFGQDEGEEAEGEEREEGEESEWEEEERQEEDEDEDFGIAPEY